MIPLEVGTGRIGAESITEELLQALLRMQGDGGYSGADGSARVGELLAWAAALADGATALDAVASNITPQLAEEFLAEWERAMRVPNDAARTREERQRRLVALRSISGRNSAPEIEAALERAGLISPALLTTDAAAVAACGCEPESVFQGGLLLDPADWTTKGRTLAIDVLRRMLPAWHFGAHRRAEPARMLGDAASYPARWGVSDALFGRALIHAAPAGDGTPFTARGVSRLVSYAPLSRVDADDLMRMQRNMLCLPAPGAANEALAADLGGARVYFFAASCATGTSVQIASGLDFRDRYVRMLTCVSDQDIRPGGAADASFSSAVFGTGVLDQLWATMSGTTSRALHTGVTLTSSSTEIRLANASGATRYVYGCLLVSPQVSTGTRAQHLEVFADDQPLTALDASWWTVMRDAAMPRAANGSGAQAWTAYPSTARGAVHRTGVLPQAVRPALGEDVYVLDSSIDWRDRMCALFFMYGAGASVDPVFPGVDGDDGYGVFSGLGGVAFYTGAGSASAGSYDLDAEDWRIFARSTDGALCLGYPSTSGDAQLMFAVHAMATDQLGTRSAASALTSAPAPSSGVVQPYELNWIQDGALYSQMRQGDGGAPSATMPLGPVKRGHTNTPIEWTVSRRRGRKDDTTLAVRQPIAGRLRTYFATTVPAGDVLVLDDVEDWRDRMVSYCVASSTSDITPGGASESTLNSSTTSFGVSKYSGLGGAAYYMPISGLDPFTGLGLIVDESTGQLRISNATISTRYVVAFVEAGPQLGPRSP